MRSFCCGVLPKCANTSSSGRSKSSPMQVRSHIRTSSTFVLKKRREGFTEYTHTSRLSFERFRPYSILWAVIPPFNSIRIESASSSSISLMSWTYSMAMDIISPTRPSLWSRATHTGRIRFCRSCPSMLLKIGAIILFLSGTLPFFLISSPSVICASVSGSVTRSPHWSP